MHGELSFAFFVSFNVLYLVFSYFYILLFGLISVFCF